MDVNEVKSGRVQEVVKLLNENNLVKVKPLLDTLLKLDPDDMEIHFLYGVFHVKKKNYHSAISNLLRVVDSVYTSIYMPQAIKILVFCYTKTNNYDIAISIIEDVLSNYFEDVQLKNMLAYIYYEQGKYQKAMSIYADILKDKSDNATALNGLGYSLIENCSRFEEGLHFCSQALEKNPEDPAILDSVGWGYYKLGEYKKAELYLKDAFKKLPKNQIIKKHITMAVEAS